MGGFASWWNRPFDADMSASRWALFLLFLLIVAGFWASTINLIKRAV